MFWHVMLMLFSPLYLMFGLVFRSRLPLSTAREAGLTSGCQPEGDNPRVREEPSFNGTREGIG